MSNLGFKSIVYHGDCCLGEVEIFGIQNQDFGFPNNEIRISYLSQPSERCHPLSILQTLTPFTVRCKLRGESTSEQSNLNRLHYSCLQELKTAVVVLGEEEFHLVAMPSNHEKVSCFWCCSVPKGLYGSCLGLLNMRCMAIVFDLDETLIVANTMRSFEDKIEALQKRISCETDRGRVSAMSAELKRYLEDKSFLKQYAEMDSVIDNGKLFKVQPEEVPSPSGERLFRPVIRLKDRNIVLTRINPEIRDTSVLVKLRPAWEDLRDYLTAKGRKRFEVYVCTMAERDYALEMWRLLDPEAHLINSNQLLGRVVCVSSGSRKSLLDVFHDGLCHPKMAMVIDDRLKVWEDMDQPRVHVVPPFTPYYDPLADTANAVPVLRIARNVACNVRAGFFRQFDENLLRRIFELCYEDEVANLPYAPDVSDFMMSEDPSFVPNGNRDVPISEGMCGAEMERGLNRVDEKQMVDSNNPDLRPETSQPPASVVLPNTFGLGNTKTSLPVQKPGLPAATAGLEVNPSEINPDARRRHSILQHGQGVCEQGSKQGSSAVLLPKPPTQVSAPSVQARGGWLVEGDSDVEQVNNGAGLDQEPDASTDKQPAQQNLPNPRVENSMPSVAPFHASQVKGEEAYRGNEQKKQNYSQSNQPFPTGDAALRQTSVTNRVHQNVAGKVGLLPPFMSIRVLQEIGRRCSSKVDFRSVVSTSKDLQFSVEALFNGEKVGAGMGKTKKDAQQQAAQNALRSLADQYVSYNESDSGSVNKDPHKLPLGNESGFLWDVGNSGFNELPPKDALTDASTSEVVGESNEGSESSGTQQTQKHPLRSSLHTFPAKRLKEEVLPGLQVSSSQ